MRNDRSASEIVVLQWCKKESGKDSYFERNTGSLERQSEC